jgi:hypothetical protein
MAAITSCDLASIYSYYYNYSYTYVPGDQPPYQVYPAQSYAAYNLGAYRGHSYQNTSGYVSTFPSTNINLGMFLYTFPYS